jgi:hypothetical protein
MLNNVYNMQIIVHIIAADCLVFLVLTISIFIVAIIAKNVYVQYLCNCCLCLVMYCLKGYYIFANFFSIIVKNIVYY